MEYVVINFNRYNMAVEVERITKYLATKGMKLTAQNKRDVIRVGSGEDCIELWFRLYNGSIAVQRADSDFRKRYWNPFQELNLQKPNKFKLQQHTL